MDSTNIQSELASIRSLMERSTKFLSLSGLSGILAGTYAIIGGILTQQCIGEGYDEISQTAIKQITTIAIAVLVLSTTTGYILTRRQAIKNGEPLLNPVSKKMMLNMLIPLITGGCFSIILLMQGYFHLIAPTFLIFYGLALYAGGEYSFSAVKWLGGSEILLGLIAAAFPTYGLTLWIIGFGVLHIAYGAWMHIKYNK